MVRYLVKNFKKTTDDTDLSYGDVILTVINGDFHLGVYVGDGRALAMEIPVQEGKSRSTIYKHKYWRLYFRAGFKRK